MTAVTPRICQVITGGEEHRIIALNVLLTYIEHLQRTKGATLGEIHSVLSIAYMDIRQGQNDAINTHL